MNLFLKKLPTFLSRVISRFVFGTNMERIPSRQEQRSRFTWKASSIFSILLEPIVKLLAEFCCDVIWTIYFVPYALNAGVRVISIFDFYSIFHFQMLRKFTKIHPHFFWKFRLDITLAGVAIDCVSVKILTSEHSRSSREPSLLVICSFWTSGFISEMSTGL